MNDNMINAGAFEYITEQEMTVERISTVLNLAYIQAEIDPDGDISIRDNYHRVYMQVNVRSKLLWLRAYYKELDHVSRSVLESAIVKINDQFIFANIQLGEHRLYVDTSLDYRNGLPAHTIVFTLRRLFTMAETVIDRLQQEIGDGGDEKA